jgi:hypothetical protein
MGMCLQILTSTTLPGTLHAFAHTDIRDKTAKTWRKPIKLVSEYPLRTHAKDDTSATFLGIENADSGASDDGSVHRALRTVPVEMMKKARITKRGDIDI